MGIYRYILGMYGYILGTYGYLWVNVGNTGFVWVYMRYIWVTFTWRDILTKTGHLFSNFEDLL